MNEELRHLFVVFQCRILKYSTQELLQHCTKSSKTFTSRRRVSLEEQKAKKRSSIYEEDRTLSWSGAHSKSTFFAKLRQTLATWHVESVRITGNVFGNPRSSFESSQTPFEGILHSTTPSATVAVPFHVCSGTRVERGEEQIGSKTTMPMSERRPSTMNSFLPLDNPQNSMVGHQRQQISELQFDKIPYSTFIFCWKIRFKNQATTCSDFPSDAMLWIKEVEMVDSLEELLSSRSVSGNNFTKFEMLDARIASALNKIIQNYQFKKKVSLEEQKAQKEDWFPRGRQIAFMIYDYFPVAVGHDTVLDCADVFSVTLHDDNIQEFDTRWDEVLLSMSKIPSDDI